MLLAVGMDMGILVVKKKNIQVTDWDSPPIWEVGKLEMIGPTLLD